MVNPLVPKVNLKEDGSVVLTVEVVDIAAGHWAEISGFILQDDVLEDDAIQQNGAFIPFSAIQQVPEPVNGASAVTVNVAATGLKPGVNVKVITRTTQVQAWPTVLKDGAGTGTWQALPDAPWPGG